MRYGYDFAIIERVWLNMAIVYLCWPLGKRPAMAETGYNSIETIKIGLQKTSHDKSSRPALIRGRKKFFTAFKWKVNLRKTRPTTRYLNR